jgi:hypothetical protein
MLLKDKMISVDVSPKDANMQLLMQTTGAQNG